MYKKYLMLKNPYLFFTGFINRIQDGHFRICLRMGEGKKARLPKICHTYPTMMNLCSYILPKEDPKNI